MNTQTESKPVARPVPLVLECRSRALLRLVPEGEKRWWQDTPVPACVEPSAEIAYGCVEWFRYDKHESPLKGSFGSRTR
jgi:hypothetical protein